LFGAGFEKVKRLINKYSGYIQGLITFHNNNGMLGDQTIDRQSMKRMTELGLAIDFDQYTLGDLFKE